MNIYIDIETAPGRAEWLRQEAQDSVRPPGSIKKPESLARWEAEERPAAIEEAYRRFALSPETGEIISIAAVVDDEHEFVRCRSVAEDEAELLRQFFAWVAAVLEENRQIVVDAAGQDWLLDPEPVHLVAHNAAFDLGFLRGRCLALGVRPSFKLPSGMDRPGRDYSCTMQLWAGYGGRVSLRRLALALGLPDPKGGGLDGAGVFDAWHAGRLEEIAAYNLDDARTVRLIYERMLDVGVAA